MTSESLLPAADLAAVGRIIAPYMERWRGKRLLLTGATGFVGRWMVESFHHANQSMRLNATLVGVAGPEEDLSEAQSDRRLPATADVTLVNADIRRLRQELDGRIDGPFDAIIHAAIQVDAATYATAPLPTIETGILGTWEVLQLARATGVGRVLLVSSGGVYGAQPSSLARMPESHASTLDPTDPASAYGESKRAAELLGACYWRQHALPVVIARPFSFVGPHLPLDRHFAIGNFIGDALAGRTIVITGDGRPMRSYMYAADLAVALWGLLAEGAPGVAYNVGSEEPVSIAQAAALVARIAGGGKVDVRAAPAAGDAPRYVPDTSRMRALLGDLPHVDLETAVRRTIAWHREQA